MKYAGSSFHSGTVSGYYLMMGTLYSGDIACQLVHLCCFSLFSALRIIPPRQALPGNQNRQWHFAKHTHIADSQVEMPSNYRIVKQLFSAKLKAEQA